ncbi:type II secretion system protein GspM [Glaciimonas sp. PCH181]|uniref:type II secretion system protein GspM n=1 Tax=Glaciimonas sp. PCH181 TaxID=2133943 RepID=UPI000D3AE1F6|nr:type II secretion system protein GspM [Glaciimonas sp. PCH181]PUA19102.1 general secretion pathway protein GspM [Glaciimonas sp. PCH181]
MTTIHALPMRLAQLFQDFWQQRQPRERTVLGCGFAVVLLALLYLVLIDPALSGRLRLQKSLPVLHQQSAQLQSLLTKAGTLAGHAAQPSAPISKEAIEAALQRKGLLAKSIVMSGDIAKVQLSDVAFSGLLDWLDDAQKTSQWQVIDATVNAQAGTVNASVTLRQQQHD